MSRDTIELLKECDAGISMGVSSINDVLSNVSDRRLMQILKESKEEHEDLKNDALLALNRYNESGKAPNPIAKTMSKLKTGLKLTLSDDDTAICEIISEGCNMGIKSIRGYINKYENAGEDAVNLAERIIELEERLSERMDNFI